MKYSVGWDSTRNLTAMPSETLGVFKITMAGEENERGENIRIHVMPTHIPLARNSPTLIAREAGNMRSS